MPEETKPYVIFRLGDEEFGVDVMNIREIAKITTITRVPRSADFIEGVINLRGSLATVINLRKRFGFEPKEIDADSRIIIAELEDKPVGMLVDAAIEVLRIPVSDIEATPEMVTTEISKEHLGGVGKVKNRLIFLLDLKQVLTKKEIEKI
jgi:purine-binding chemotaxis protein CheW